MFRCFINVYVLYVSMFYKFVLIHYKRKHISSRTYKTLERLGVCLYNISSFCVVSLLSLGVYLVVFKSLAC